MIKKVMKWVKMALDGRRLIKEMISDEKRGDNKILYINNMSAILVPDFQ